MYQITCHYCFETLSITLFREEGEQQEFITDCEVCCHPLKIQATWDEQEEEFNINVEAGLD